MRADGERVALAAFVGCNFAVATNPVAGTFDLDKLADLAVPPQPTVPRRHESMISMRVNERERDRVLARATVDSGLLVLPRLLIDLTLGKF